MSSICQGMNISNQELSRCSQKTHHKYCESHQHKYRFEKPDECAICTDSMNETEIPLECGHWMHSVCLRNTNIHKCPFCNTPITEQEIAYFFGQGHIEQNNYNDGNSIFWTVQGMFENAYDENADDEFGHGEQEEIQIQNIVNTETSNLLLNYVSETITEEEQIRRFEQISPEQFDVISNDIEVNQFESPFIEQMSLLHVSFHDDSEEMRERMILRLIVLNIDKANYSSLSHEQFMHCVSETLSFLMHYNNFYIILSMLMNFKGMRGDHIFRIVSVLTTLLRFMIIETFDRTTTQNL